VIVELVVAIKVGVVAISFSLTMMMVTIMWATVAAAGGIVHSSWGVDKPPYCHLPPLSSPAASASEDRQGKIRVKTER
jgi:hypothetical protein